jgi:uncharacterized protein with HEPN domain
MPLKDEVRLAHILDAILEIEQISQGLSLEELAGNRIKQLALSKLIEIVGEAANSLSAETRAAIPEVNWSAMIAVRNRLFHACFEVDYEIIWSTIYGDLPGLKLQLQKFIDA